VTRSARWPDREAAIHVWIGRGDALTGWQPTFLIASAKRSRPGRRSGFRPLHLRGGPAAADVHVSWIDHCRADQRQDPWARDRSWWIINGNITIALHHNEGELLDEKAIHAIALHEVGHLLGLDHTADTSNIMTARVRVRSLSDFDRNTMKLLYTLPPGSVKK
jgi:hypothetical protein